MSDLHAGVKLWARGQKPRPRRLEKRAAAAARKAQWRELRSKVLRRDRHACRACGRSRGLLDAHHILARSQGGKDELTNLVTLCRDCHCDVTGHVLIQRWTEPNRAKTIRFERVR